MQQTGTEENAKVKLNINTKQLTTVKGSYKTPYVIKAKHFHSIFWLSNSISVITCGITYSNFIYIIYRCLKQYLKNLF